MKSDLLYVDHVLECIRRIEEYARGGEEAFFSNTLIQDGVIRNLQTLAESSKRINPQIQAKHPDIPWRQMAGFRNIAVHEYLDIDLSYVWEIVSIDLPALLDRFLKLRSEITITS